GRQAEHPERRPGADRHGEVQDLWAAAAGEGRRLLLRDSMIVGVDIGTQSLKVAVTDHELQVRGEAATPYRAEFPRPGWREQDPALWEHALGPTIARALSEAGAGPPGGAPPGGFGPLRGRACGQG